MKRRRKAQHTHLPRSGLKMCFLTRRLTFFGERRHHRGVIPPQPGAGCPPRSLTAHSPRRTNDPMFRTPFTRVTGNPPNSVQIAVCASVCVLTGLSVYPGSCTRQEAWSCPSRLSYFVSSRGPHGGFGKRHRDCTVLNPSAPDVRVRGRREAQPFGNKRVLSNCSGNEGTACPSRVSAGRFPTPCSHTHTGIVPVYIEQDIFFPRRRSGIPEKLIKGTSRRPGPHQRRLLAHSPLPAAGPPRDDLWAPAPRRR